jgi:hypothetical protein
MPILEAGKKYRARNGEIFTVVPLGEDYMWEGFTIPNNTWDTKTGENILSGEKLRFKDLDLLEEVVDAAPFTLPAGYEHNDVVALLAAPLTDGALGRAFTWNDTPQGYDYWYTISIERGLARVKKDTSYRLPFKARQYLKKCVREYERQNPPVTSWDIPDTVDRPPVDDEIPF